ncbi:MAG: sodium:proline symporter [Ignavibacteria bacterium RBG_13_36_8]|nr:MAG: sodium:proline symporter [Ignavibacteria bacterium RBG_13_36_8]
MNLNNSGDIYTLVSFIGYIILILLIGILSARFSSKGLNEFFLGGRKMNKFVVALSAVASGRSSWLLIGLTGMAFTIGASALWAFVGYVTAEFLMFLFAAPRLREQTERNDNITIPDYFESRHNDSSHLLRILSVLIIIIFMTAYISAQFVGGGKAFSTSFGVSQTTGVIVTALIVLIYTLLGGFMAVSLTDVVQAIFMIIALFIVPILSIIDLGGIERTIDTIKKVDITLVDPFALSTGALIGFVGIGFGSPGNPHILVRYMSIDDPKKLRFSAYMGTFWNAMMGIFAVMIGLVGRAYFTSSAMLPDGDPENLFPFLAQQHLHPILFGIVIAAILAAIMSTADSMLLVCASAVIRDIYQKVINPKKEVTEKELVLYSRIIIFILVNIALIFGYIASDLVFWLVLFAWGGLGAAFGPPLLLSLFWKRTTRNGVAAGFISGMLTVIVWNQIPTLKNVMYELIPAFLISLLLTIVFSLVNKPKRYEIIRKFR